MAETPSVPAPPTRSDPDYWCYQCEARVAVETLPDLPDVICNNCKSGFVESIPSRAVSVSPSDQIDGPTLGNQFIQVLRLIAEAALDSDAPPRPPSEHADPSDDDYLRVELDGWGNEEDDEDEEEEEEEQHNELFEVSNGGEGENRENRSQSEDDEGNNDDVDEDEEDENRDDEEDLRRRRRDVLRLRLRDFAARAANRRNRILDWAEILMGLEDHSIELRLQVPDVDGYIGNPGDYVDAAGYEALLQTLAESDGSGRRGAPPASMSAIEGLDTFVIKEEQDVMACAICKDVVTVGETAKNLPCGHGYHHGCIVQWLGSRNSCPVCRFELATDDPEYEEERKKRGACATSRGSSSSGEAADAAAAADDDSSPSCL